MTIQVRHDAFVPDVDGLARRALKTLRARPVDWDLILGGNAPLEELGERERSALRDVAADVAAAGLADYLSHAASAASEDWAARYKLLLALVDNPRLLFLCETFISAATLGHRISGPPVELLIVRMLFFISQITFNLDKIKGGVLYPNHELFCNVNSLISTGPCNCGQESRLLEAARRRAESPDLSDEELADVYAAVNRGEGDHGSFLRSFAEAFCRADRDNVILLRPAALAFVAQYGLARYLPAKGGAA